MSDDEHDLGLPKSCVGRYLRETLPPQARCSQDTRDLIAACCTEFIHMVATHANDIAMRQGKTMLTASNITTALQQLGFGEYVEEAAKAGASFRTAQQTRSLMRQRSMSQESFSYQDDPPEAATSAQQLTSSTPNMQGVPMVVVPDEPACVCAPPVTSETLRLLQAMDTEIYDDDEV